MAGTWCTLIVAFCDVVTTRLWNLGSCSLASSRCCTPWCFIEIIGSSQDLVHSTTLVLFYQWSIYRLHFGNQNHDKLLFLKTRYLCLTRINSLFHASEIVFPLSISSDVKDVLSDDTIDDCKSK